GSALLDKTRSYGRTSAQIAIFAAVWFVPGTLQASTVAQVEQQAINSPATLDHDPVITAIVGQPGTGDGFIHTNYDIVVNDGTGSMQLLGTLPDGNTYVPTVGDAISVTGTLVPFKTEPEINAITAITKVSSGNPVPGPIKVTIPQIQALAMAENF